MKIITIYVTHKNKIEAEKISNLLLKEKLIACVNYFPINVAYHWKWDIANEDEIVSLLKTKVDNWELIKNIIMEKHKYETPCIMKTEVEVNEEYWEWIYNELKK